MIGDSFCYVQFNCIKCSYFLYLSYINKLKFYYYVPLLLACKYRLKILFSNVTTHFLIISRIENNTDVSLDI